MSNAPFVDWLTVRQNHLRREPLPLFFRGVSSYHTAAGICVSEVLRAQSITGSWDSSINVQCDGACVLVSGNVGRFGRPDNLFNRRWRETLQALERICDAVPIPRFCATGHGASASDAGQGHTGAIVSRVDITKNFRCGSDAQARAFIRHLQTIALSRAKRGLSGDESVWWVNTRRMVKAYNKAADLMANRPNHIGLPATDKRVQWCRDNGIVRIEVEMKRRLLCDLGLDKLENINDQVLAHAYSQETEFLSRFDSSDEPDILAAIPAGSRAYAAAWLSGSDLSQFVSRATLFRHARVLREYGLNIMEPRNVQRFPTKVRVIELEEVQAPDWYEWEKQA